MLCWALIGREGWTLNELSNEVLLAAVSLIVASLTVLLPLFWRFLQSRRLRQEQAIHRESHNLKLFEALASRNHQLQLAAAAVLVERLVPKLGRGSSPEHRVIIRALLAVTKDNSSSSNDPGVSRELSKFVADQVAKNHKIPLKEFDWQNTKLSRAWWPKVDAHGVDFWNSDLSEAGMRDANLKKAVFIEANLAQSVLAGADLQGARFDRADLRGADLSGAKIDGAVFSGALFDEKTCFPENFSLEMMGLRYAAQDPADTASNNS